MSILRNEPALITAAIQAALTAAVAFGLELTPEQMTAVLTLSGAVLALIVRAMVVPAAKVQ